MTLTSQLDVLFADWQSHYGSLGSLLVKDGPIGNDVQWLNAFPKCLFLLKDPNDRNGVLTACAHDLRELLRRPAEFKQDRKTMARVVTEWTSDILRLYSSAGADTAHSLAQAAIINLKKLGGVGKASEREIRKFARNDAWFILRQIELLKPDIVICGGTAGAIRKEWSDYCRWDKDQLLFDRNSVIWIDHFHPCYTFNPMRLQERHEAVLEALKHNLKSSLTPPSRTTAHD